MNDTIGFIGLGRLGLPVATNLLSAGYTLRVYNRTTSKAEPLVARGAELATTPADAVFPGGIVITILWDDTSLESVVMSDGFLERLGPEGIHVSMTTVSPEMARKLAAVHARHGSAFVEATIFGRPEAAVDRNLIVPIAGPRREKERVRPLLEAMGAREIFDFGEETGAAALVKLVGNFLIVSAGHSMREALSVARDFGVDPKAVVDMLTSTLFSAPIYQSYGKRIVEHSAPFGQSPIPLKDVDLFRRTAEKSKSSTPIAAVLHSLLTTGD